MGGFYGSIQVLTPDADPAPILQTASQLHRTHNTSFWVGPSLNNWTALYPENAGQDLSLSEALASLLPNTLLHLLVHDDDLFAYRLYQNGSLVDEFLSAPGYFDPASRSTESRLTGNPDAFAPLLPPTALPALRKLLVQQRQFPESSRLQSFAKLLHIQNAVTSYEYLNEDDHAGIKCWRNFTHIPERPDHRAEERNARATARAADRKSLADLKARGLLLQHKSLGRSSFTRAILSAPEGLLVNPPLSKSAHLQLWTPPWETPTPLHFPDKHYRNLVAFSPSHRFLAVESHDHGFEIFSWPNLECLATRLVPHAVNLRFEPDEQILQLFLRDLPVRIHWPTGERLPISPAESHAAIGTPHPNGTHAIIARGYYVSIFNIPNNSSHPLYVGGKFAPTLSLKDAFWANVNKTLPPSAKPRSIEKTHRVQFSSTGEFLFLSAETSLYVYRWSDLAAGNESPLPFAQIAHVAPDSFHIRATSSGPILNLCEDPHRRLLYFIHNNALCTLDLTTAESHAVFPLPDFHSLSDLTLTLDASVLAFRATPAPHFPGDHPSEILCLWNLPALLQRAGLQSGI